MAATEPAHPILSTGVWRQGVVGGGDYLRCELIHAANSMGSRAIKEGIARVMLQTCKCPQHIGQ